MKIRILSYILSASLLAIGGILSFSLITITTYLHHATVDLEKSRETIYLAEELKLAALAYNRYRFLYLLTKNSYYETEGQKVLDNISKFKKELDSFQHTNVENEILEHFYNYLESFLKKYESLEAQDLPAVDIYLYASEDLRKVRTYIDQFILLKRLNSKQLGVKTTEQKNFAKFLGIVSISAFGMVIIFIFLVERRFLYLPLRTLKEAIIEQKNSSGNRPIEIKGVLELQDIAMAYNDLIDQLKRSKDTQLRSIASIAHDLRNPLSAIRMSLDMLHPELPTSTAKKEKVLEIIKKQSLVLEKMIEDLLDSAKIQSGSIRIAKDYCNLKNLVDDSINLFRNTTSVHHFVFENQIGDFEYHCDSQRMNQVFNNLLSNAIKYSPYGGEVKVTFSQKNNHLVISFEDQGIGISGYDIPRIFESFRRSKAIEDTIPGVGLGLAASKKIIEAHGGQIQVDSILDYGSTFQILLPIEGLKLKLPPINKKANEAIS